MIRKLSISGFKSLFNVEVELGRVNCFIGANGVGKSNILEALGVLGAAANSVVDDESLLRRRVRPGVPRLYKSSFTSERTPAHIRLEVEAATDASYRISLLNPLDAPEPAWKFKTETLFDGTQDILSAGVRSKKNLNPHQGLAALKMVELDSENPASQLLESLQNYAIYCPNTPTLRGITPDQQSRTPVGLSGGLLAEGFKDLVNELEKGGDAGEAVLNEIFSLIDWVRDISTTTQAGNLLSSKVARSKVMLKFTDRFMAKSRNELTAYDASEGALYVIFAALLCLSPRSPQLISVDNLDQALNPRLLSALVRHLASWLEYANPQRQLLFTSHNPAVLDGLDLSNPEIRLFAVERNNKGLTRIRRIELDDPIKKLNQEYPLSRLWLMGHLGAVPNV